MREIKAYVRPERVEDVALALRDAGIPHMTILHVHSLGTFVDPKHQRVDLESALPYTEHAVIEFASPEPDVDPVVRLIREQARTGERGDGVILVSTLERAIKIRTGEEGQAALR